MFGRVASSEAEPQAACAMLRESALRGPRAGIRRRDAGRARSLDTREDRAVGEGDPRPEDFARM